MAVLLRVEQSFPDGMTHVVPMLYPTGRTIPKEEREQAEHLDVYLAHRMPEIAAELHALDLLNTNDLKKWHALGERLEFVDDTSLVSPNDRDAGAVWLAVRQHAPPALLPRGEATLTPALLASKLRDFDSQRRLGKKHDHFERCYKLGKFALQDVDWLTWSDFDAFLESPGIERDERILRILSETTRKVGRRLTRKEVRAIFKHLREAIPTKHQQRDTSSLPQKQLEQLIAGSFVKAGVLVNRFGRAS